MGHSDINTTKQYLDTEKETKLKGKRVTKKKIKAPMKISA